jgi:hypothetical protein
VPGADRLGRPRPPEPAPRASMGAVPDQDPDAGRAPTSPSTALVAVPAPVPPAPAGTLAATVEYASRTVLGAALLLGGAVGAVVRQAAPGAPPGAEATDALVATRQVALGVAAGARDTAVAATTRGLDVAVPVTRFVVTSPPLRPLTRVVVRRLGHLAERGRAEEDQARQVAARTGEQTVGMAVPVVLDNLDLEPVVDRVLSEIDLPALVERVMGEMDLEPIVDKVIGQLDLGGIVEDVMGDIRMSSVVLDATGGLTTDIVDEVRDRSVAADSLLERVVAKVVRRKLAPLPPVGLPAAEPEGRP